MSVQTAILTALIFVFASGLPEASWAQFGPPGSRRGGFRGRGGDDDDGGRRGGFRRGGDGEDDRGRRGGFRGGPPGGFRGGGRGGRGGGRGGGFDPSGFLRRLDRNGNGTLDPDEQQGPASFLIRRLQSADSSIRPGEPISIDRVSEAFERMRRGRGDDDDERRSSRSSGDDDSLTAELLVPGFGVQTEPPMLPGFGPAAEMMSVQVTEEDREEASRTLRRFDRNRDGVLGSNELSSRFAGNPMDFDRNKDGRLTLGELAVRYARRREANESRRDDDRRRSDRGRRRDRDEVEMPNVYGGRKSYRAEAGTELPEGLPGFFTDKDANGDGQVEMPEFASKWDDATVNEFFKSDLNRDGIITAREALEAVEREASADPESSSGDAMASRSGSSRSEDRRGGSRDNGGSSSVGTPNDKMLSYAERIIKRYDKNEDNKLVGSEWEKMLMSPAAADADRDGTITVKEYAWWMQSRANRR